MRTRSALLSLVLVACGGDAPPALQVGPASYSSEQLLGLSPSRVLTLAHLTAFGLAVADSSTAELGAPLVARWEDDRLLELLAAELTLEKNGVGDDVLEARYRTDPDFELTVRHILFFSERWRTPDERAAAKAKAERALQAIRGGADFAETAATLSEEPGAEGRQGLLTPGREGAWVDEFWAAASALDVGEISPVTETEYGYHILRLEGRDTVPFTEARSRVAMAVADRIEDPGAVLDAWLDGRDGDVRSDAADEAWAAWAVTEPPAATRDAASLRVLARRRVALAGARRRGLGVSAAERASLERRWSDRVYQWSATLGFSAGMGPEGVTRSALQALGATGQGAGLARSALDERGPLLEARYPVRLPTSSE